jgi:hypothetical protein
MNLYGGVNRKGGSNLGPTRTIEVIVEPVPQAAGGRGITLANWLVMSGSGYADAFNSPNHVWSLGYRDTNNPQLLATQNISGQGKFNQNNVTYVYGSMVYSAPLPGNTNLTTVTGGWTSPDNIVIPSTADPIAAGGNYGWTYQNPWNGITSSYSWTSGTYPPTAGTYATLTASGGSLPKNGGTTVSSIAVNGTSSSPQLVIINGDFIVSPSFSYTGSGYITVWVKGQMKVQGGSYIQQAQGVNVTYIVDGDLTFSGNSTYGYGASNNPGYASAASAANWVVVGSHTITNSGQSAFIGTIDAPLSNGTISGQGDYTGAIVSNNLTISGQANFHYDESLGGASNPLVGNYAFVSWFEDNADPKRNALDVNGVNHPIVY